MSWYVAAGGQHHPSDAPCGVPRPPAAASSGKRRTTHTSTRHRRSGANDTRERQQGTTGAASVLIATTGHAMTATPMGARISVAREAKRNGGARAEQAAQTRQQHGQRRGGHNELRHASHKRVYVGEQRALSGNGSARRLSQSAPLADAPRQAHLRTVSSGRRDRRQPQPLPRKGERG